MDKKGGSKKERSEKVKQYWKTRNARTEEKRKRKNLKKVISHGLWTFDEIVVKKKELGR